MFYLMLFCLLQKWVFRWDVFNNNMLKMNFDLFFISTQKNPNFVHLSGFVFINEILYLRFLLYNLKNILLCNVNFYLRTYFVFTIWFLAKCFALQPVSTFVYSEYLVICLICILSFNIFDFCFYFWFVYISMD